MSRERLNAVLAIAAAGISIAAYARALGAGFYSDDYQWLARMAPTLDRPLFLFTVFHRDFNPLLHATFVVDWLIGGGSAWAYHAGSLATHGAATALVVLIASRLSERPWAAFAAGLLWGVGVRLSEAVIWPAARGHALATVFSLAAVGFLGSRFRRPVAAAALTFACGLLAKETALFPMLLAPWFAADRLVRRRATVVLGTMAAAFVAWNVLAKPDFHVAREGAWAALRKLPYVVMRPLGLGEIYDFSPLSFALFAAAGVAIAALARRSPARLGLIWVALAVVPILPLQKLSSRYLYLLSAGFPLAACGALAHPAIERMTPALRRVAGGVLMAATFVLCAANVLMVQREIEDYRALGEPYAACFEGLRPAAAAVQPGETLVVVETRPRDGIATLARRIDERGTVRKLIPERDAGVGGFIELADIVNAARPAASGFYAIPADPDAPGPRTVILWDGRTAVRVHDIPSPAPGSVLAAALVPAAMYYRAAR